MDDRHLQQILKTFSHEQQVSFTLHCVKEVESIANDPRVIDCNRNTERWLNGDKSADLNVARDNAWNAARNNADIATITYYAVDALVNSCANYAAYAANAAAYANSATYYAPHYFCYCACYHAVLAKAYHVHPNNVKDRHAAMQQFLQEYIEKAKNWLNTEN